MPLYDGSVPVVPTCVRYALPPNLRAAPPGVGAREVTVSPPFDERAVEDVAVDTGQNCIPALLGGFEVLA